MANKAARTHPFPGSHPPFYFLFCFVLLQNNAGSVPKSQKFEFEKNVQEIINVKGLKNVHIFIIPSSCSNKNVHELEKWPKYENMLAYSENGHNLIICFS